MTTKTAEQTYSKGIMAEEFVQSSYVGVGLWIGIGVAAKLSGIESLTVFDAFAIGACLTMARSVEAVRDYSSEGKFGRIKSLTSAFCNAAKNIGHVTAALLPLFLVDAAGLGGEKIIENSSDVILLGAGITGLAAMKTGLDHYYKEAVYAKKVARYKNAESPKPA